MSVQTAVASTSKLLTPQQENVYNAGLVQNVQMVLVHLLNVEQLYLNSQKFIVCRVSMGQISLTVLVVVSVNLVEYVQANMKKYSTSAHVKIMSSAIAKLAFIGTKQMINVFHVVLAQAA